MKTSRSMLAALAACLWAMSFGALAIETPGYNFAINHSLVDLMSRSSATTANAPGQLIKSDKDDSGLIRFNAWINMLSKARQLSDKDKLVAVNDFFNLFPFGQDSHLWGVDNYWATPVEFIRVNGGDCEDFSIGKYFSLLELGIPEHKLRLSMVKTPASAEYHMLLAYRETPYSTPLLLDNLVKEIQPASQRRELASIYSFNDNLLWINDLNAEGQLVGSSMGLEKWQSLKSRMRVQELNHAELRLAMRMMPVSRL